MIRLLRQGLLKSNLKPGMTASVSIVVARRKQVLEIPNAALRFEPPDVAMVEASTAATSGAGIASTSNRDRSRQASGRLNNRVERGPGETDPVHTIFILNDGASGQESKLRAVRVNTGITDNIYTEILSGLKAGDRVVTGLAIPDLASGPGTRNPFGLNHRL